MTGVLYPCCAGEINPAEGQSQVVLRNRRFLDIGVLLLTFAVSPASAMPSSRPVHSFQEISTAAEGILLTVQDNGAAFKVRDVWGPAGVPIPLDIRLGKTSRLNPKGQLFIFSGLPAGIKLSPGGNFGQFWAVNSKVLNKLTLKAPENFSGSFAVSVTQTGTNPEDPKRSVTFMATITGPESSNTVAVVTPDTIDTSRTTADPNRVPKSRPARTEPNLRDEKLMERATTLFSNGDISGARIVFEYLVARGNVQAAIALGGTYDPNTLEPLTIKGLTPDPERAQFWYRKAEELGSTDARNRIKALAKR